MRIFSLVLALFVGVEAFAYRPTTTFATVFDKLSGVPAASAYSLGSVIKEAYRTMICKYDYSVLGGAVGNLALRELDGKTTCKLPTKAIIRDGLIDVITNPTSSGSATIALTSESAGDLFAATAYGSVTGKLNLVPVRTAATAVKLTAERTIYAAVAASALTAGKFRVFLDFVQSE